MNANDSGSVLCSLVKQFSQAVTAWYCGIAIAVFDNKYSLWLAPQICAVLKYIFSKQSLWTQMTVGLLNSSWRDVRIAQLCNPDTWPTGTSLPAKPLAVCKVSVWTEQKHSSIFFSSSGSPQSLWECVLRMVQYTGMPEWVVNYTPERTQDTLT